MKIDARKPFSVFLGKKRGRGKPRPRKGGGSFCLASQPVSYSLSSLPCHLTKSIGRRVKREKRERERRGWKSPNKKRHVNMPHTSQSGKSKQRVFWIELLRRRVAAIHLALYVAPAAADKKIFRTHQIYTIVKKKSAFLASFGFYSLQNQNVTQNVTQKKTQCATSTLCHLMIALMMFFFGFANLGEKKDMSIAIGVPTSRDFNSLSACEMKGEDSDRVDSLRNQWQR